MQEEIEHRMVALVVSAVKFTGREFRQAIEKYLAERKAAKQNRENHLTQPEDVIPHGKQTVQELIGQNQGASSIELDDPDIKAFDRIARKSGVDYAIQKVKKSHPPKYLIFFKARDGDVLQAALQQYATLKFGKSDILDRLHDPLAPPKLDKDRERQR